MRARWLALGLLLGCTSIAIAQGGPGFFMSPACSSIANPVTGQTVCWQSTAPTGFYYWDGAAFAPQVLGGPYAPTTLSSGFVLLGGGTGPITATTTPSVSGLTTTGQAALTLGVYGASAGNTGEMRLLELAANGTNYVYLKSPDSIATTFGLVLPSIPGTSGQCLGTDGSNPVVTSWVACSPGAGSGITTLNALTAVTQTFANDTNLTMVSATSTHTLTWAGTLAVARGGLGVGTLALNGVVLGNGTSAVVVSAAGAANTVFRVPGAGGTPAFGAVDVSQAAAITGLVRTANLGSGTADATVFLRGDQTWSAAGGTPVYNYVFNSSMEVWGAGTTVAPTGWTLGVSVTAARNTTAGQFRTGAASVSVTASSASSMTQDVAITYPPVSAWQSQVVTCGAWVRATLAASTKLRLADGVSFTDSANHTGGSTFEFLTVSRSISNVATQVTLGLFLSQVTTSQFDAVICVLGSSVANWQPSGYIGRKAIIQHTTGSGVTAVGAANNFGFWGPGPQASVGTPMPFRAVIRNLHALITTAPGGAETQTFIVRVNEANPVPQPTCVISAAATQCSDLTNEVLVAKSARVASRVTASAAAGAAQVVTMMELEEVPEGI